LYRLDRPISVICRAKLNLVLEITGKRPDGYHDLATLMHPIGLADELTILPGEAGLRLERSGLPSPAGEGNVAYRAAQAFSEASGIAPSVTLHLYKRIPAEAGLGGGSADAAGVLRGLATLRGWPRDDPRLAEIARSLGADVPFFLSRGAALAEGLGERLTPLPPARFACVLAIAAPGVSTGWAYSQVRPEHHTDGARARRAAQALRRRGRVHETWNGFEAALASARPDLRALIERVRDLVKGPSGLTGSGSGVFGLVEDELRAGQVGTLLAQAGYWAWWGHSAAEPISVQTGGDGAS